MNFETFCADAFGALERSLESRKEVLFWAASRAIPPLDVVERHPAHGYWYAKSDVPAKHGPETVGVSLALIPGELRVGIIIPKTLIDPERGDDSMVAISPDGQPPDITREVTGGYLYDRIYHEDPFSPAWIVAAYSDPAKAEATALAMASLVANTWKTAFGEIVNSPRFGMASRLMLYSPQPLPMLTIMQAVPLVVLDAITNSVLGHTAMTRSHMSVDEAVAALAKAGITGVQVAAYDEPATDSEGNHVAESVA